MYVGNNNNSILVYEVEQIFYAGLQLIRINDLNHNQIGCCTDLKGTFLLYISLIQITPNSYSVNPNPAIRI